MGSSLDAATTAADADADDAIGVAPPPTPIAVGIPGTDGDAEVSLPNPPPCAAASKSDSDPSSRSSSLCSWKATSDLARCRYARDGASEPRAATAVGGGVRGLELGFHSGGGIGGRGLEAAANA
ncbi:hypothetical protein GUJ93_ZPchr0013g36939 [Zizania palustris]|uniref:Uncharacterized protein n=1 Tax=Zizania palustris TaxID=103762 RepID=A0A8J5WTF1_ZIZPA|nr:hypothetical protein GUJ93_ZPchr0013g36939 [Zizania palustris]